MLCVDILLSHVLFDKHQKYDIYHFFTDCCIRMKQNPYRTLNFFSCKWSNLII
jgi:hypothetical protein